MTSSFAKLWIIARPAETPREKDWRLMRQRFRSILPRGSTTVWGRCHGNGRHKPTFIWRHLLSTTPEKRLGLPRRKVNGEGRCVGGWTIYDPPAMDWMWNWEIPIFFTSYFHILRIYLSLQIIGLIGPGAICQSVAVFKWWKRVKRTSWE